MEPATTAALVAGGARILGGFLSDRSNRKAAQQRLSQEQAFAREQSERSEALQREFAQHGVRWRVEDAKAAGLHPLFALGGAGASYSPGAISIGGGDGPQGSSLGANIAAMGQDVAGAIRAQETPEQAQARALQLDLLRSQIDENDARTWQIWSQTAMERQGANARPGMPPAIKASDQYLPQHVDVVKPKPDEVVAARSDDRGVTAATHPAEREYALGRHGLRIRLPYSEEGPSEALENVPWWMWPALIQRNRAIYGDDWGTRFLREYVMDNPPKYRQHPSPHRYSEPFPKSDFFYGAP